TPPSAYAPDTSPASLGRREPLRTRPLGPVKDALGIPVVVPLRGVDTGLLSARCVVAVVGRRRRAVAAGAVWRAVYGGARRPVSGLLARRIVAVAYRAGGNAGSQRRERDDRKDGLHGFLL